MVWDRKSGTGQSKNGQPENPQWMDPAARSDRFEKRIPKKHGCRTTVKSCTQRSGNRTRYGGQNENGRLKSTDSSAFLHGHFYTVVYGLYSSSELTRISVKYPVRSGASAALR